MMTVEIAIPLVPENIRIKLVQRVAQVMYRLHHRDTASLDAVSALPKGYQAVELLINIIPSLSGTSVPMALMPVQEMDSIERSPRTRGEYPRRGGRQWMIEPGAN